MNKQLQAAVVAIFCPDLLNGVCVERGREGLDPNFTYKILEVVQRSCLVALMTQLLSDPTHH